MDFLGQSCMVYILQSLFTVACLSQGNTKYMRLKDLNAGAFGFVVLAKDIETDEAVAVKFMKRSAVNKVRNKAPSPACNKLSSPVPG